MENYGEDIVTLTMDDGGVVKCTILGIFEAENESEYVALLPVEGEDAEEGQVYLYRYSEKEDGTPVLENIIDDEEFDIASEAFEEMMEELEFEEDDEEGMSSMIQGLFTPLSSFAFMVFTLLYIPCFAAIGTIKQETNSWKWPLIMSGITLVTAYIVSFLVYNVGLLAGFG